MPTAYENDTALYYDIAGSGETVVFVPDAGLGGWSWGWQHAALTGPFETLVWDLRGTGRSDQPPGPYDLETLAADLDAVLADAGVRTVHVVGAGLGGAIALTAARESTRVETLTLFGTALRGTAFDLEPLFAPPDDREAIRSSLETVLSPAFQAAHPAVVDGIVDWRADGDATQDGWTAQCQALTAFDASDWAYEITQPALVIHGTNDTLVSPDAGRELTGSLPRGEYESLAGAGHLAYIERSRVVNDRLIGFFESSDE